MTKPPTSHNAGMRTLAYDHTPSKRLKESVVDAICIEADLIGVRQRKSTVFNRQRNHAIGVLVANLLSATLYHPNTPVAVVSNKGFYAANKLLTGDQFTFAASKEAIRVLRERGYVEYHPGRASRTPALRRTASIRAKPKLLSLLSETRFTELDAVCDPKHYPIRLRDKKDEAGRKQFISYPPTLETYRMIANAVTINSVLGNHWVDIELTPAQYEELARHRRRKATADDTDDNAPCGDPGITFSSRYIYRVFNNGTFLEGGRFYGHWVQGIPSDLRPYVTINGKRTVELDYSAIHPTLLCNKLGIPVPSAFYEIGIGTKKLVKQVFNALINARGTNIREPSDFDPERVGMGWDEFLARVKAHYRQFKEFFGTGYGLKLQRIDSDVAEAVMLHFAKNNIPVIPIHDSFIMHHGYEGELKEAMNKALYEVTGATTGIEVTALSAVQHRELLNSSSAAVQRLIDGGKSLLAALIDCGTPFGAHERRLDQWWMRGA